MSEHQDHSVTSRWKEEVDYREGDRVFTFPAGWGRRPFVLYVPAEVDWDELTPVWMHGRRAEIVARLERDSDHVVQADPPRVRPIDQGLASD